MESFGVHMDLKRLDISFYLNCIVSGTVILTVDHLLERTEIQAWLEHFESCSCLAFIFRSICHINGKSKII